MPTSRGCASSPGCGRPDGPYANEELLGRTLSGSGRRDEVVLATKFGTILHTQDDTRGLDGSPANLRLVTVIEKVAGEVDATPAQVALAWLLAQGDDIAPIPGTRRIERVEENIAAAHLSLSPAQLAELDAVAPAVGDRYADMTPLNR